MARGFEFLGRSSALPCVAANAATARLPPPCKNCRRPRVRGTKDLMGVSLSECLNEDRQSLFEWERWDFTSPRRPSSFLFSFLSVRRYSQVLERRSLEWSKKPLFAALRFDDSRFLDFRLLRLEPLSSVFSTFQAHRESLFRLRLEDQIILAGVGKTKLSRSQ